ncbi:MAG: hypothetical protein OXE94_01615, partial [Aestuariivita sp.]|nr:hypothetical protein [Aestuariivita sp.]
RAEAVAGKRPEIGEAKIGTVQHGNVMRVVLEATEGQCHAAAVQDYIASIQLAESLPPHDGSRLRVIAHHGDIHQFRGVRGNDVLPAEVVVIS